MVCTSLPKGATVFVYIAVSLKLSSLSITKLTISTFLWCVSVTFLLMWFIQFWNRHLSTQQMLITEVTIECTKINRNIQRGQTLALKDFWNWVTLLIFNMLILYLKVVRPDSCHVSFPLDYACFSIHQISAYYESNQHS